MLSVKRVVFGILSVYVYMIMCWLVMQGMR